MSAAIQAINLTVAARFTGAQSAASDCLCCRPENIQNRKCAFVDFNWNTLKIQSIRKNLAVVWQWLVRGVIWWAGAMGEGGEMGADSSFF